MPALNQVTAEMVSISDNQMTAHQFAGGPLKFVFTAPPQRFSQHRLWGSGGGVINRSRNGTNAIESLDIFEEFNGFEFTASIAGSSGPREVGRLAVG